MVKTLAERLTAKTDKTPGFGPGGNCWKWLGKPHHTGYGRIMINGKDYQAHRLIYEQYVKPIPAGLFVCHTCDNRRCVNPLHLWPGTHDDNMRDMVEKKRGNCSQRSKTHCKLGHLLGGENQYANGISRKCKTCNRTRQNVAYATAKKLAALPNLFTL